MTDADLSGVIPIAYTPFDESGNVDYESLRRQVRTLADDGCHGVALFGLASEYHKLADAERERMMNIAVELCEDGDTQSIISVTHHATKVAIEQARAAEDAGADYLMLLPPFFLGPGEEQIYDHVMRVANAVSTPIVLQYAPDHTGVTIAPGRLVDLYEETATITHFKIENIPSGPYITQLLNETEGECSILVGRAGYQMIEAYDRGAVGVLPGAGYYDIYLEINRRYRNGDRGGAAKLHNDLLALLNHTTQSLEMAIAYGKRALCRRDVIDSAYCRFPSFEPDSHHDDLFDEHYASLREYRGTF